MDTEIKGNENSLVLFNQRVKFIKPRGSWWFSQTWIKYFSEGFEINILILPKNNKRYSEYVFEYLMKTVFKSISKTSR